MFKWFNKDKNESNESRKPIINKVNNYETQENGDIKIKAERQSSIGFYCTYKGDIVIPKSSIISHTENNIVFKDYRRYFNFESKYLYSISMYYYESIKNKENFVEYKETQIKTYEYFVEDECWKLMKTDIVGIEVVHERTPLEIFKEQYKSKYKLIETEDEFNEYMASTLDCNTWCRKKLYNKMKELELGDGFINQFADLVGNDLDKYYAMIDLANEVSDKDTLMYLYTYKFGNVDKKGLSG